MFDTTFSNFSRDQVKGLLRITGNKYELRMSDLLIDQLHWGLITNHVHPEKILEEIESLEGRQKTRTRAASQFTKGPLAGLWKKHWYQSSFLSQNVFQQLELGKDLNKLNAIVRPELKRNLSADVTSLTIANKLVQGSLKMRSRSGLTGEWIIFKKVCGKNLYLTLAYHNESQEVVAERIASRCAQQFNLEE